MLEGCNHIFGEVYLIRLFEASEDTVSGPSCPLCRAAIQNTYLIKELDETLMNYYEEKCHNRMEMETEVYRHLLGDQDLMDLDYREDFAGFEIDRSQDGRFIVYDQVFVDQNSKNEMNLYLKAVLSSIQH